MLEAEGALEFMDPRGAIADEWFFFIWSAIRTAWMGRKTLFPGFYLTNLVEHICIEVQESLICHRLAL